jgi:hypothetical protein
MEREREREREKNTITTITQLSLPVGGYQLECTRVTSVMRTFNSGLLIDSDNKVVRLLSS